MGLLPTLTCGPHILEGHGPEPLCCGVPKEGARVGHALGLLFPGTPAPMQRVRGLLSSESTQSPASPSHHSVTCSRG